MPCIMPEKKKKLPLGYGYEGGNKAAGAGAKKGESYIEFVKRFLKENKGKSIADAAKAWRAAKKGGGGAVPYAKKGRKKAARRLLAQVK